MLSPHALSDLLPGNSAHIVQFLDEERSKHATKDYEFVINGNVIQEDLKHEKK